VSDRVRVIVGWGAERGRQAQESHALAPLAGLLRRRPSRQSDRCGSRSLRRGPGHGRGDSMMRRSASVSPSSGVEPAGYWFMSRK